MTDAELEQFIRQHPDGASEVEIAQFLGVTRQAVHGLIVKALGKLRSKMKARGFDGPIELHGENPWQF